MDIPRKQEGKADILLTLPSLRPHIAGQAASDWEYTRDCRSDRIRRFNYRAATAINPNATTHRRRTASTARHLPTETILPRSQVLLPNRKISQLCYAIHARLPLQLRSRLSYSQLDLPQTQSQWPVFRPGDYLGRTYVLRIR